MPLHKIIETLFFSFSQKDRITLVSKKINKFEILWILVDETLMNRDGTDF